MSKPTFYVSGYVSHWDNLHALGRIRRTREAADVDTRYWVEFGHPDAQTWEVKKPRATWRDVKNQIVVWCSWVRS
jgi:hypothetical protein